MAEFTALSDFISTVSFHYLFVSDSYQHNKFVLKKTGRHRTLFSIFAASLGRGGVGLCLGGGNIYKKVIEVVSYDCLTFSKISNWYLSLICNCIFFFWSLFPWWFSTFSSYHTYLYVVVSNRIYFLSFSIFYSNHFMCVMLDFML